nr:MAG TPA: hypothetical protein [Caudoviricetes sp.]DAH90760.1 MAG TPA: hypothetical protein [Caudoviricetes sp.]
MIRVASHKSWMKVHLMSLRNYTSPRAQLD